MQQSMMAILALILASMMVLQQQQRSVRTRANVLKNEISMMATGVAVDRLEEVGALAFDQATADGSPTAYTQLTAASSFGPGKDKPGDDIDDAHSSVPLDTFRVVGNSQLWFRTMVKVTYADPSDPNKPAASSSARTKFKKVTAMVVPLKRSANEARLLDEMTGDTIRISRSFSCGGKCKW